MKQGKIAFVGEAWGKDEQEKFELTGVPSPFVGYAGWTFNSMLSQVGIDRSECLVTNVFNLQPKPTNNVQNLCGPRPQGIPGYPFLQRGKYVYAKYQKELDRLFKEIERFNPNIIVCLGATPTWAFLKTSGIKKIRGSTEYSWNGYKVLPTYHPAAVNRQYKLRPIVVADLYKALRESNTKTIRRLRRKIYIEPSIVDIKWFIEWCIDPAPLISADIETVGDIITCIGFAPSETEAMVIPFYDHSKQDKNYWPTAKEELQAWKLVKKILLLKKKFLFQNGMYDMQFLWAKMGLTVPGASEDSMLLQHALQPEMEKGLAFLASIYTDESSWKQTHKTRTIKKED